MTTVIEMSHFAGAAGARPESRRAPRLTHVLAGPRYDLTPRERQILTLLADGHSTIEVARLLSYSERTIKNDVQDLTARFHLRNRTQAVAHAIRNQWI